MDEVSGSRGLLDTSVVIALRDIEASELPGEAAISALTLAELVVGPLAAANEMEGARRQRRLMEFESGVQTLSFDARCARAHGEVYAAVTAAGRKARGSRVVDLMIAATALAHGLPLYTMNAKDLRGVEDVVEIVNVGA